MPRKPKKLSCDEQMAIFLPEALRLVLESYNKYAIKLADENNDDFARDHADCKMAVTHIELLLKLAQKAESLGGSVHHKKNLMKATREAVKVANGHYEIYPEDRDL